MENIQDLRAPSTHIFDIGGFFTPPAEKICNCIFMLEIILSRKPVLTKGQNFLSRCAEVVLGCGYTSLKKYGRVHICLPLLHLSPVT